QTHSGINASLADGGGIAGKVTAASDATPLSNIRVTAYDSNGAAVTSTFTDVGGLYEVDQLPTGTFRLGFADQFAQVYAPRYFHDAQTLSGATGISVTAGSTVPDENQALQKFATMSGQVVDGNNTGLADICAEADSTTGNAFGAAPTAAPG